MTAEVRLLSDLVPHGSSLPADVERLEKEIADDAGKTALSRAELLAAYFTGFCNHLRVSGHVVHKRRGRPQGGIADAARRLATVASVKNEEGWRKAIERAIKIDSLSAAVKTEITLAGLADRTTALLAIARKKKVDEQRAVLRKLVDDRNSKQRRENNWTAVIELNRPLDQNAADAIRQQLGSLAAEWGGSVIFGGQWRQKGKRNAIAQAGLEAVDVVP